MFSNFSLVFYSKKKEEEEKEQEQGRGLCELGTDTDTDILTLVAGFPREVQEACKRALGTVPLVPLFTWSTL